MRALRALVCLLSTPAASFRPPPCLGVRRYAPQHSSHQGRMAMVEDSGTDELEATLDALVRAEVEAAFAGLEASLDADDEKALQLIEQKGQEVMQNVLDKLEADGKLLSSALTSQIELLSMTKQKQMLEEYDASTAELQRQMAEERQTIRDEMAQLRSLSDEYKALTRGGGGGFDKGAILGGLSFIVGLTYASAALNEALKVAMGGGDDGSPTTIALNFALGAVGIGYHFYRKGQVEG
ncbi:hypothetical protein AB1Y20_005367 [Prymnesium parvum]